MRCCFSMPLLVLVILFAGLFDSRARGEEPIRSHPPMRKAPPPGNRPRAEGKGFHADSRKGDDKNDGTQDRPWRTIAHALTRLQAGDTLYLRNGVFYENVYVARAGRPGAPITIRSAPGEQAIIDGSVAEFQTQPGDAWEPVPQGAPGEYRSKKPYPNLRTFIGSFGDSMIGLQTYYHAKDLGATNETIMPEDPAKKDSDIKALYCGPGLWYDNATGHIHLRLAPTHVPAPAVNYRGETDPRKLPLVLAGFQAIALHVDQGSHLRFQDLIIRGGGYTTVLLDHAVDVEFDNVTIWCGTYGIRAACTGPLRFHRSALYGNAAPWTYRSDTSKRDYPGRPYRNITRLNTHALLEIASGLESSVYATPQNDRWEFSYSEFTEGHDGLYLGGINVRFHHNLVENLQDDGLYLSPMYFRHRLDKIDPEIHIHENVFRGMLTALAFGGTETTTRDRIFIYRNLFDLRAPVYTGRPSAKQAGIVVSRGKLMGDHGSPPWPTMTIYQNTFVMADGSRDAAMAALGGSHTQRPRRVFNNIFYHFGGLPGYVEADPATNGVEDGNVYAADKIDDKVAAAFFQRFRASPQFAKSKDLYPPGSTTHSRVGPAGFMKNKRDGAVENDYRLRPDSAAVGAGVALPAEWPDPLRAKDKEKIDAGALPLDAKMFPYGRKGTGE